MSETNTPEADTRTPAEKLAEIIARRKSANGAGGWGANVGGRRDAERSAAARSASKSKPAMKK
jgi:hypothetical protein